MHLRKERGGARPSRRGRPGWCPQGVHQDQVEGRQAVAVPAAELAAAMVIAVLVSEL